MTEEVAVRSLADGVIRAARWSGHLSPGDRRMVLRLWLAQRLAGQPPEVVRQTLRALTASLEPARASAVVSAPAVAPEAAEGPRRSTAVAAPVAALIEFAARYYGNSWESSGGPQADADRALEALNEMEAKLRSSSPKTRDVSGLRGALDSLTAQVAGADAALQKAAQESFARLLESLNPSVVETQVGGKGFRMGPFHKASLYDAWCERFDQLRAYHDSGRLVGDLRSAFKRYLKECQEEEKKR